MDKGIDIKITVRSDPKFLCAIRGLVRNYLGDLGIDANRIDEAVLAVDEACANAIRHSYQGLADHEFELSLSATDGYVDIALEDEGIPVPMERVVRKELTPPDLGNLKPGGLGVQLMYRVFDEVRFVPGVDQGNSVIMRLKRNNV